MQTTINERIKKVIDTYENKVNSRFAKKIGVSASVVANYMPDGLRKGEPSFSVLRKILESYPQVRMEWLVSGEEPMEKKPAEFKGKTTIVTDGEIPGNAIPFYDIDINAGNVQRLIDDNNDVPLVGWMHLEDMASQNGLIGVRAKGGSMASYINSGDVMLIRRLQNHGIVHYGTPHVLITPEQSLVKYIWPGPDKEQWELRSHNHEQFPTFPVPRKEIKHLFAVVKVLKDITY